MDSSQYIHSPSSGNAILAYGTSKTRRPFIKWVVMIGLGIGILFGLYAVFLLFAQSELPKNRILTLAISPNHLKNVLKPEEIVNLPDPWRSVIETKTHLPAYIGLYLDNEQRVHSFGYLFTYPPVAETAKMQIHKRGIFQLLITGNSELERIPFRKLLSLRRGLKKNDAAWEVNLNQAQQYFFDLPLGSEDSESLVRGTWKGKGGVITNLSENTQETSIFASEELSAGELVSILGKNPSKEPILSLALLSQGIDIRFLEENPSFLQIDESGYWHMQFLDISEKDSQILPSIAHPTSSELYLLPDGTVSSRTATATRWEDEVKTVIIPGGATSSNASLEEGCAEGVLRFRLSGAFLQGLLASIQIPHSWREQVQQMEIREQETGVIVCVR